VNIDGDGDGDADEAVGVDGGDTFGAIGSGKANATLDGDDEIRDFDINEDIYDDESVDVDGDEMTVDVGSV
jgi:hypothetical protein